MNLKAAKTKKNYYKVCRIGGGSLYQDNVKSRKIKFIEKSFLNTDKTVDCAEGIYFCTAEQLPIWWQNFPTEIRVVKPVGQIVKTSKGFRTDKLKYYRILSEKEVEELGKKYGYVYKNRIQTAGNKSTQTAGVESTQTAGDGSTQKAGDGSTQTAGIESIQKAGNKSTQTAGNKSTQIAGGESTQTAENWSTQKAGHGSTQTAGHRSTQKAGAWSTMVIFGDISYIIKQGENCILRQIFYNNGKCVSIIIDLDEALKNYKTGDRIKFEKGVILESQ